MPCAPRKFAAARSFLPKLQMLFTWEPRIRLGRGAGLGRQAGVLGLQALGSTANFSKRAVLEVPLQTATRSRIFLFLFFFPSLLSVPRPQAARVPARVRPMPKLGGVYYCTNSSSDLP